MLTHPGYVGDNNQLLGIRMSISIDADCISIPEQDFNVDSLEDNDVVLLAGSHGLNQIERIKGAHKKTLVVWSGHQFFNEFSTLSEWPDLVALPKSACTSELRQLLPEYSRLIETDGVAHCINESTINADLVQFQGTLPDMASYSAAVGIMIAGDAPTPDGSMRYFSPENARLSAQQIVRHIRGNNLGDTQTAFIITNGPRTGKHNPDNGLVHSPEPHRHGISDLSSQAFIDVFKAAFPGQVYFFDFQFGSVSAYKPAMNLVSKATRGAWYVPAESSSMVTESTFLSSRFVPVVIYTPSSANDTHLALVEDAYRNQLVSKINESMLLNTRTAVRFAAKQIAEIIESTLSHNASCRGTDPLVEAVGAHGLFKNGRENIHMPYHFSIKGRDSVGVIELVKNPRNIDKQAASFVLVESFIGEYEKYLSPHEISDSLTSWRDGDKSVQKYYENYFKTELEDFSRGDLHYWVQATINGKLVGWATFQREKSETNAVYMNLLVVHPEYQKCGIGDQLVKSLVNLRESPDLNAIHLLLRTKNSGGRTFYSKLGFTPDPEYQRDDNFVDRELLEGFTWKKPSLQHINSVCSDATDFRAIRGATLFKRMPPKVEGQSNQHGTYCGLQSGFLLGKRF
jgi:GNAT superfamily N-acetyltransferase